MGKSVITTAEKQSKADFFFYKQDIQPYFLPRRYSMVPSRRFGPISSARWRSAAMITCSTPMLC